MKKCLSLCENIFLTVAVILSFVFTTGCDSQNKTDIAEYDGLTVSYIDVGQGDSILLECDKKYMLIDAGENDKGEIVSDYIKSRGINHLDYAVCTHPHSDHIGGMDTVMNEYPADAFIYPNVDYNSQSWDDVLSTAKSNNSKLIYASPGETYSLGDADFVIYSPQKNSIYSDCNNYSVIIRLSYKSKSFLFTGDAEETAEKEVMEQGYNLKSDVLKVGHHGSTTSTGEKFLDKVSPKYAVISCGTDNKYGHPDKETLDKLKHRNIKVYRTDQDGTIIINTDGESFNFITRDNTVNVYEEYEEENPEKENTANILNGSDKISNSEFTEKFSSNNPKQEKYIGNKNSLKFHREDCGSLKAMNDKNKVYFNSRHEALKNGYSPCKSCNP